MVVIFEFLMLLTGAALVFMLFLGLLRLFTRNQMYGSTGYKYKKIKSDKEVDESYASLYQNEDFVNKGCKHIDDFTINDSINQFDLLKLAEFNNIRLSIEKGWYPLVLQLLKELNDNGWDKRVTCIKQKYGELKFYINTDYNSPLQEIIDKYESLSEETCETCGGNGTSRWTDGDWMYIACRKHYLESRIVVTMENDGFKYGNDFYYWKDVKDAEFNNPDYQKKIVFIKLQFKKAIVPHGDWLDNELYIYTLSIGFGNLIHQMPKHYSSLDLEYAKNYATPVFCETCGYKAVYNEECECCENKTWSSYLNQWKNEENSPENKLKHLKSNQMMWELDEGEYYEAQQNNYSKNPNHKILYTTAEFEAFNE